ncbi:MAG TPA: acyl-CoA dehydrogenase [Acidimicrobiales bacterium]
MTIALSDDHQALADVVADLLQRDDTRGEFRSLLEAEVEPRPRSWARMAELGWLGLHLDERHGGSGFGLPELVVVVEQLGRHLAPGPFVPTVVASAVLAATAPVAMTDRVLPGLVDGSSSAGIGLDSHVEVVDGRATGDAGAVLGGASATVFVLADGPDLIVVEQSAAGVEVTVPENIDPSRRSARVRLEKVPVDVVPGAAGALRDVSRLVLAAEATGVAHACTDEAAAYAGVRVQFGRPIGTFQAVKHHCANMLVEAELATALVWAAARAGVASGGERAQAAAMAACVAVAAAVHDAQLNIQVHGGIGFTWEHDAHLFLRRALAISAFVDEAAAAEEVTRRLRDGTTLPRAVDLPPEAESIRREVRPVLTEIAALEAAERTRALVRSGYAVAHWPEPFGRDAGAVEQLVVDEELAEVGLRKPNYGITGWVLLTLVQHGTPEQVARWVPPALDQELIWCQLFSEPDAGSDAAGITTRARRVEGGWSVTGQKVWTSGAHEARFGLATVRTDPAVPKHQGITTMVIDMHASGVEVRPLRMPTGGSEFNEVFLQDVFVPDDDVVGAVDQGWTVARATLGNESVSIGGSGFALPPQVVLEPFAANPERLTGGSARVGRYAARAHAVEMLTLRGAQRAVAGGGPGPEGALTKLVLSENCLEMADMLAQLAGPELAFRSSDGLDPASLALSARALAIAGGTSEIKRNQIGERLLGLPRDPLVS